MGASSTTSSDVDDIEAERLRSVAVDSASVSGVATFLVHKKHKKEKAFSDSQDAAPALKFYQSRARDFLHQYLDRTFKILPAKDSPASTLESPQNSGFHLFKNAPSGLSEKGHYQEAATRRKRRLSNSAIDEASEMFQSRLVAAAVDGAAVKLYADRHKAKCLVSWGLRQAEEDAAKKKEEKRIASMKLRRGELWLPSIAREMQRGHTSDGKPLQSTTSMCPENRVEVEVPRNLSDFYTNVNLLLGVNKIEAKNV